ncbi:MAG: hypothetical protein EZS28_015046 [Streblomastix strix]|uniref:B30.2/SPRY domain-containing protein n=1 Tax=Streblomastix strix TaxID=222440 RepID=A0A5J4W4B2_9EUKA|nr:MAG: hypothetical protein EZS28_015046 [Streblomastix strix]
MLLITNAVQFLGVNKKTFQLMKHSRFTKIIEELDYPISVFNQDPKNAEFIDIDGVQKMLKILKQNCHTFPLTQVLENGIWTIETIFGNSKSQFVAVGIVQDSYIIPLGAYPWEKPHNVHNAFYVCKSFSTPGGIYYKGTKTAGNIGFEENQIVRLEFDSEKGTLVFFVNGLSSPTSVHIENEKAVKW